MIEKLSLEEIVRLFGRHAGAAGVRLEADVRAASRRGGEGEFVKDVMAVANGTAFTRSLRFVLNGVNPDAPDPFVGVTTRWDDNEAQALARSALDPVPEFVYYEVDAGEGRWVGVTHVVPRGGFFVVSRDLGKLREGQSLIRQGSITRGVTRADHLRLYLSRATDTPSSFSSSTARQRR